MSLEQKINFHLNKVPALKKIIKLLYQRCWHAIYPRIKSEGKISGVSPNDGKEYFFGYYVKSPWDISGRYMLCLRANKVWSYLPLDEIARLLLINMQNNKSTKDLALIRSFVE